MRNSCHRVRRECERSAAHARSLEGTLAVCHVCTQYKAKSVIRWPRATRNGVCVRACDLRQFGGGAGQQGASKALLRSDGGRKGRSREHGRHHVDAGDPRLHVLARPDGGGGERGANKSLLNKSATNVPGLLIMGRVAWSHSRRTCERAPRQLSFQHFPVAQTCTSAFKMAPFECFTT